MVFYYCQTMAAISIHYLSFFILTLTVASVLVFGDGEKLKLFSTHDSSHCIFGLYNRLEFLRFYNRLEFLTLVPDQYVTKNSVEFCILLHFLKLQF